jgi:hypothetical protein
VSTRQIGGHLPRQGMFGVEGGDESPVTLESRLRRGEHLGREQPLRPASVKWHLPRFGFGWLGNPPNQQTPPSGPESRLSAREHLLGRERAPACALAMPTVPTEPPLTSQRLLAQQRVTSPRDRRTIAALRSESRTMAPLRAAQEDAARLVAQKEAAPEQHDLASLLASAGLDALYEPLGARPRAAHNLGSRAHPPCARAQWRRRRSMSCTRGWWRTALCSWST